MWKPALVIASAVLMAAPDSLNAQGKSQPVLTKPVTSCGPSALILVTVVTAAGVPVGDAMVVVRRAKDGVVVREGGSDLPATGEYIVLDDLALSMVEEKGTRFTVQVHRGKQKSSAVLRIGKSVDACHVRLLSGATRLTLR